MNKQFQYQSKPEKQLKAWYNSKVLKGVSDFADYNDFKSW